MEMTLKILFCVLAVSAYSEGYKSKQPKACKLRKCSSDCRVYKFAFTGIEPGSFVDGHDIVGPRVDLMKEVCCRAKKRCQASFVPFNKCWNANRISEVLDSHLFDVCLEVSDIPVRRAVYLFSSLEFFHLPNPIGIVKVGSTISISDLQNPGNNLKVAHLANSKLASSGMLDEYKKDYFVQSGNEVPVEGGPPNFLSAQIVDLVNTGQADVGLVPKHLIPRGAKFKELFELDVDFGGSSMMVRKDEPSIVKWWDKSLKKFACSKEYAKFCRGLDKKYGAHPNNCIDTAALC